MKTILITGLSILIATACKAQTFEDCSDNYHKTFNKVQLRRTLKEIDAKAADSVIFALGIDLDRCIIGKEMPEYNLVGISGKTYTNESLRGKVVLFNFWSVSCGPCVVEIPVLNRLRLAYKDNPDFILISILWDKEETLEKVLGMGLTKRKINYEVIPDSKALMKDAFKSVKVFPTNFFVDREGTIFMKTIGGISDSKDEQKLEDKLRSIIDSELSKSITRVD